MRKIRIAQVITRLDKGGSADIVFYIADHLDKSKYDVTLICGRTRDPIEGIAQAISQKRFDFVSVDELVRPVNPVNDLRALAKLRCVIRRGRFDIVHTHTSKAGMLGRIAASGARVPVIIHNPHGHVFYEGFDLGHIMVRLYKVMERYAAGFTDKIITLTDVERADYVRFKFGGPDKFVTIHSGADIDRFLNLRVDADRLKNDLGIAPGAPVIGDIAYLVPRKGHTYLLDAAQAVLRRFPSAVFLLVGDGDLKASLQEKASRLGISKSIIFAGWRKETDQLMGIFDIFVFPSISEGMGMALVEALAAKRPVVASSIMGIKDLVKDGINGLLVRPADPAALADALIALLSDPAKARSLAERGPSTVDPEFRRETMMARLDLLYEELLGERGLSRG